MKKLILATTALVTLTSEISHAQPNNILEQSIGSVNECYHGVHSPSSCTKNVYVISGLLHGTWKAVDKPWTLEFSPNGITDITDGTATMSTIGPPKTGKYHIQSGADDSDYAVITIDMDNGQHFRSDIAMFHSQLIIVDSGKSTTFDRSSFSSN